MHPRATAPDARKLPLPLHLPCSSPPPSHQAELLVIDEAAAIPLPLVKALLGPYLVFMASTVNGYEGTGRSLSLKLFAQLRKQSVAVGAGSAAAGACDIRLLQWACGTRVCGCARLLSHCSHVALPPAPPPCGSSCLSGRVAGCAGGSATGGRSLREVEMAEPIRYNPDDPIETWLSSLLCLDSYNAYRLTGGLPSPKDCELFIVDRDALFSFHQARRLPRTPRCGCGVAGGVRFG